MTFLELQHFPYLKKRLVLNITAHPYLRHQGQTPLVILGLCFEQFNSEVWLLI